MTSAKIQRCAIYTRVSTDAGLEQEFNSLDAQREASEAFIKSQAHEGWRIIPTGYNDGGFSGGTMDRPALQQLLEDIRAGKIDIVLVYKVDRLTRSLADFAKLVETLEKHNASFVSVTQAFNTTTSMGRLTLNVLLSFAQFEREVTAERIRDKIDASKKKGIWMGGNVPLGYRVEDRKLVVEPSEAETVRMIFKRYLELGSMLPLLTELHAARVMTRSRARSKGQQAGGVPFTWGPLSYLLKNRIYVGEINHRGTNYPGEHAAIVDRQTFDAVQAGFAANLRVTNTKCRAVGALLTGKIYDDRGNRMAPTYSKKKTARYHYYTCRLLKEGRRGEAGSVHRLPAAEVDDLVIDALKSEGIIPPVLSGGMAREQAIDRFVSRIEIHQCQIKIQLMEAAGQYQSQIVVPWTRKPGRPKREIQLPHIDQNKDNRPIRAEVRMNIVRAVAQSRLWLSELVSGQVADTNTLAKRENRSRRSIRMLISLAFVAPDIIGALIEGKLPRGIGITKLVDLPSDWGEQRRILGIGRPGLPESGIH